MTSLKQGKPGDAFFVTPRLNVLYNAEDDEVLLPESDAVEEDVEETKHIISSLPLESRTHRDLAVHMMNPREELAKFTKTIDENPAFDFTTVSLISPYDALARKQVQFVMASRANYIKEENKYNSVNPENAQTVKESTYTFGREAVEGTAAL
jgi:hypothetical protein